MSLLITSYAYLTLIVSTRNRCSILPSCLDSLISQVVDANQFEIILVDNGSTDNTRTVAQKYPDIRYVLEPRIGLSIARNTGISVARTPWIAFIDDDAKAHPDLLERALGLISKDSFDVFGGMYYPWFKYGKPAWLPEDFGQMEKLRDEVGEIKEDQFLAGGIFFAKKEALLAVGGYRPDFGMNKKIGYGEDDEIQVRLRKAGYKIGFDPHLAIDHCVMPHKLKLSWHLKSMYAKGYAQGHWKEEIKFGRQSLGLIRSLAAGLLYKFPRGLYRLLFSKGYPVQRSILDICLPVLLQAGRLFGKIHKDLGKLVR